MNRNEKLERLERAIEEASDRALTALAKELAAHPRFRKILAAKLSAHVKAARKLDAPEHRN